MATDALTRLSQLTKSQRLVLATLRFQDRSPSGAVAISGRQLAQETELSRRTVQAALTRLETLGFLRTHKGDWEHPTSEHTLLVTVPTRLKPVLAGGCS